MCFYVESIKLNANQDNFKIIEDQILMFLVHFPLGISLAISSIRFRTVPLPGFHKTLLVPRNKFTVLSKVFLICM
jgi:hypothetical protein